MSALALRVLRTGTGIGVALVVLYTALISGADGITKLLAGRYAPPQLYAFSGAIVIALSLLADRHGSQRRGLRTGQPVAMALRSAATVLAAIAFFQAFRLLPFAQVFLFVGMIPILSGLMSGPILGEYVRPAAWLALVAGCAGVSFLFPAGVASVHAGHVWASVATLAGTFSMVMARYIGLRETNPLAQVFYPNLALCLSMALALPLVWVPMQALDLIWIAAYSALLFAARWVLVEALSRLTAYTVTPLMNLQFVWMAVIGAVAFGEVPGLRTFVGAGIVLVAGGYLVWSQILQSEERAVDAG